MRALRSLRPFVPLLLTSLALACASDSGDGDGTGGQGGEGGAPGRSETTRTIGQKGGQVTAGTATVTFPAGAVPKNTSVTVATLSADEIEQLPQTMGGVKLIGFPAKFTPHGLTFEQPVDVTLGYDAPKDETTPLVAMKLDNDQDRSWEVVPDVAFEAGSASFKISGFSIYGIFEDPNDVAGDLYGPEPAGTGGTNGTGGDAGSGGAVGAGGAPSGGSGGSSEGGNDGDGGAAPSGGTAGGGGAAGSGGAGGSGGFGGSGGGSGGGGVPNGYFVTPSFSGYGFVETGSPSATITVDMVNTPAPHCATGTTGSASGDSASLFYNINQDVDFTFHAPLYVDELGAALWINTVADRELRAELRDDVGNAWCAPLLKRNGVPEFIPWETFTEEACGLSGVGTFDPAENPLVSIGVTVVPSTGEADPFTVCLVDQYAASIPPGYWDQPEWFGYGFDVKDPGSTVQSGVELATGPHCASGTTGADENAASGIGYTTNQPIGQPNSPKDFTAAGVRVQLLSTDGRQYMVEVANSTAPGQKWCAPLPETSSSVFIPRTAFNSDCLGGQGSALPDEVELDTAAVYAVSSGIEDDPFGFCLLQLAPDDGASAANGYLNGPFWHGEGFVDADVSSTVDSDMAFQPGPNCASGTTGAESGAFAALGYNINQPLQGPNVPTLLTGQGVVLGINLSGAQDFVVELTSTSESAKWCAPLAGSGTQFIPYSEFTTACDGSGTPISVAEVLVDSISVVALGTGSPDEPFDFCISELRPQFGSPAPAGYLQNAAWQGYGQEFVSGDATITFNAGSAPLVCATGTTGISPSSEAGYFFAVNESSGGGDNSPVELTNVGVWVKFDATGDARPYVVRLVDTASSKTWCSTITTQEPTFVPWTNFSDDCADPENGNPPEPGVDQIDYVGLFVPSTGIGADPYLFCIHDLEPLDVPPGYLNGPSWFGYGSAWAPGGTIATDLYDAPAPNCFWGETGASESSWASLEYNVNQGLATPPVSRELGGDGLLIEVDNPLGREVTVQLWSWIGEGGYCAILPPGPGPHFIPWESFNDTCWTTGGFPFETSVPVDIVSVIVESSGIEGDPYDICVLQVQESTLSQ